MQEVDLSILCADFLEDASGHLDEAEQALLLLEQGARSGEPHAPLVTRMLGSLHTLKGNSGMMGFTSLQRFVHELEGVLKLSAAGEILLSEQVFGALFSSLSALRGALGRLAEDHTSPVDLSAEQMLLQYLVSGGGEAAAPLAEGVALPDAAEEFGHLTRNSDILKVKFSKLDELLNLVGELVIQRTALSALESRLKSEVKDRELMALFSETSEQIALSAAELRESIMKVRMLPASSVFSRFNRLVRDLGKSCGKEVELRLEGEETELDKSVIDQIGEPLLHLVRNAVDHGIEAPAERLRRGKPAAGLITLGARHDKEQMVVYLRDDGRGLDPVELKARAVSRGVLDPARAAALSDQESLRLVFLPGFSTSERLTETSGRGIGLDVVDKIAGSLGGSVEIETVKGSGTTFSMKLPLTLAIVQALLVEVSGAVFALPLSGVLESLAVSQSDFHGVAAGELFRLRDRLLPVKRLNRFFSLPEREGAGGYLVVAQSGAREGGLLVDRLLGRHEIVVKGLDDYLGELPGISGATVLGDGSVALILDLPGLLAGRDGGGRR